MFELTMPDLYNHVQIQDLVEGPQQIFLRFANQVECHSEIEVSIHFFLESGACLRALEALAF